MSFAAAPDCVRLQTHTVLWIADDSNIFAKATFCPDVDMRRSLAGLVELTRRLSVSAYQLYQLELEPHKAAAEVSTIANLGVRCCESWMAEQTH